MRHPTRIWHIGTEGPGDFIAACGFKGVGTNGTGRPCHTCLRIIGRVASEERQKRITKNLADFKARNEADRLARRKGTA